MFRIVEKSVCSKPMHGSIVVRSGESLGQLALLIEQVGPCGTGSERVIRDRNRTGLEKPTAFGEAGEGSQEQEINQ